MTKKKKMSRSAQRSKSKQLGMKQQERAKAASEKQGIRAELSGRGDPGFGTGPTALGIVKAASEEARHVTCPECGYGGGRHAAVCSRA